MVGMRLAKATPEILSPALPRWPSGKESACLCRRHGFDPWVRKIPWGKKWQLAPVFLPGKSHGQRSLEDYRPWGHKKVGHALSNVFYNLAYPEFASFLDFRFKEKPSNKIKLK